MATSRLDFLIEHMRGDRYLIFNGGEALTFVPDSPEWFLWLTARHSFHFKGQSGHFSARCEHKPSGNAYWYAYRKARTQRLKHYLGTVEKLTIATLEQTARELHEAALRTIGNSEVLNTAPREQKKQSQEGLLLGPLMFCWEDGILFIKTPTEPYGLTGTQTAELLEYLYDRRRTILKTYK